jgi:hypothetical protein
VAEVRDFVLARASLGGRTSADQLWGNSGQNLYFADLSGTVRDRLMDRTLVEIAIDLNRPAF